MRSRRSVGRQGRGEGRRRGQGEGRRRGDRGRRRRRTTPTFMDHNDDDDRSDELIMSQGYGPRRTLHTQTTTQISLSTTSLPRTFDPVASTLWMNTTVDRNGSLLAEEHHLSTLPTTTTPMAVTSSTLTTTTQSRPRRTRRPRRNRNRGSRRRKNQRASTPVMGMTTERAYYPDSGEHPLWGIERRRQHHDREGAPTSRLERLIADVRSKLTMNRDLVTQMPRSLCATMTSVGVSERRCWNGTSYSRSVNRIDHSRFL